MEENEVFVPVQYVEPAGHIKYTKDTEVAGHIPANGAAVSRVTYAKLFAAVGTTFGIGDGYSTFNVPNFAADGFNVFVSI
jgi:phage-related tail fiber protein